MSFLLDFIMWHHHVHCSLRFDSCCQLITRLLLKFLYCHRFHDLDPILKSKREWHRVLCLVPSVRGSDGKWHEPDCLDAYMQPFLEELQALGPLVPNVQALTALGVPKPCMGLPESQIGEKCTFFHWYHVHKSLFLLLSCC